MDSFKPPATEIIGIEEREDGKYLVWKKNRASDVVMYRIYARTLEPTVIDESNFIFETEKTEWKVEHPSLEEGGIYYFYILAKDDADNVAEEIKVIQLTI